MLEHASLAELCNLSAGPAMIDAMDRKALPGSLALLFPRECVRKANFVLVKVVGFMLLRCDA